MNNGPASGFSWFGFFSITSLRRKHPDWFASDLSQLLEMLKRGEIKPRVAERIAIDAVADAHTRIERVGLEEKVRARPQRVTLRWSSCS